MLRVLWAIAASLRLIWTASPRRFLASVGPQAVTAITAAVQIVIMRDVIATVLAAGNGSDLGRVGVPLAELLGLTVASSAAGLVQQQQQALLSAEVERHQNALLLDRISGVDLKPFETPEFQDLLRRAMTAMGHMMGVTASTIGLARDVFLIVGIAAALYVLQPTLLVLALIGFGPMWLASVASSRRAYRFWRSMTPNDRLRAYILGLFTSREYAKELRAFALTPYLRAMYERLSVERVQELAANLRTRMRYSLIGTGTSSLLTALTYGVLAYLVIERQIGLAEAGAAVAASQQLSGQLSSLVTDTTQLYESSLYVEDWEAFSALARARLPQSAGPVTRFGRIELDHVSFGYPQATRLALDDISLSIRAGEVVALVGENGSGKTTLAKLLSGLYRPDGGRVLWDGIDVGTREPAWIHERVAVLFQDFARFMLTARENIGFGRIAKIGDRASLMNAAQRAGADGFIEAWPTQYDTMLGSYFSGGTDVSIGQWQRIALARAFFRDAPLVILDEPTAALDARAEHDLFARMRELFDGRAVLLVSHRFSSVRSADRICVLHEGRVVEQGTHEDLMRFGGRYAELFNLQASAYA